MDQNLSPDQKAVIYLQEGQAAIEKAIAQLNYNKTRGLSTVVSYLGAYENKVKEGKKQELDSLEIISAKEAARVMGRRKTPSKLAGVAKARAELAKIFKERRELRVRRKMPGSDSA